jgi:hypothetical protein
VHVPAAHSVVTVHLIDGAGEPTLAARDRILSFLRVRLLRGDDIKCPQ